MSVENVLASVAVKDLAAAEAWYTKLLGRAGSKPMAEVIEWTLPNGGGLQIYALAERAGQGSFTLVVRDIADEFAKLNAADGALLRVVVDTGTFGTHDEPVCRAERLDWTVLARRTPLKPRHRVLGVVA